MKAIITPEPGGFRVAILDETGKKVNGLFWPSIENCQTWARIVHPRIPFEIAETPAPAERGRQQNRAAA